jgi:hypothetical protein
MEENILNQFANYITALEQNDEIQSNTITLMKQQIIEINSNRNFTLDLIHEVQKLLKPENKIITILARPRLDLTKSKTIPLKRPNTTRELKPLSKIEEHIFNTLEGNIPLKTDNSYLNKPLKRSI